MRRNRPAGATSNMMVILGVLNTIANHGIAQDSAAQDAIEDPFRLHLEHMFIIFAGGHRDFVEPMLMLIASTARNERHIRAFLIELIESPYPVPQELLNTILTEMERFLQLGLQAEATLRVMIAIASLMVERDDPRAVEALNRTVQIALKHDSSNWHTHLISLRNTANDVGDTILITTIDKAIAQTEAMELEQLRNRLIEQGALLEEVISSEPVSTGRNLRFDHGLFLDMMRFSAPINIIVAARLSNRTYSEITDGSDFEKIARCLCDLVEARNTCNLPSNPMLLYEALKAANGMEQFESTGRPTFRHQTVLRIINLMKQEQHPNLSAAYTLYGQVLQDLKGAVLDGIKNKQAGQLEYHLDDKVQYCKMAVNGLLDLLKEEYNWSQKLDHMRRKDLLRSQRRMWRRE